MTGPPDGARCGTGAVGGTTEAMMAATPAGKLTALDRRKTAVV